MDCGSWIADLSADALAKADCGFAAGHARAGASAQALRHSGTQALLASAALLFCAAQVFAQVDVTAALDVTDGLARPGAYVPVRLRVTNRTGEAIHQVRIGCGCPVDVSAAWRVAPEETADKVVPIFYAGGDLRLTIDFMDAAGAVIARAAAAPPSVRPVAPTAAVVGVAAGLPEPGEALQKGLLAALDSKSLHMASLPPESLAMLARCGLLDAIIAEQPPAACGRAIVVKPDAAAVPPQVFPLGTEAAVQEQAFRLFGANLWPAADRRRLWLWLGVFALAVPVLGAVAPRRRRAITATAILVSLAAAATAFVYFFGEVRLARVAEARVFYESPSRQQAGLEHFFSLESRGGAAAEFALPQAAGTPLPLPVLLASEDLFRPRCTLDCGNGERIESRVPQALLHILETVDLPFPVKFKGGTPPSLAAVSGRADVVAALLVDGTSATDAAGVTQTVDGWAVDWSASADADLAYAGRSLAWWSRERHEGTGRVLLVWWRDEPPPAGSEGRQRTRFPALVVYAAQAPGVFTGG